MPGRYADELRRMTRAQDGGGSTAQAEDPPSVRRGRSRRGLLLGGLLLLVLIGGGWMLVRQMLADSKLQDCVMSGRKNCIPVEGDPAGR